MLLLLILGFGECSEPPVPPPPPAPTEQVAPRHPPSVRCQPTPLPEAQPPASLLRLIIGARNSQELGPFPGQCQPADEPGALCAVRCGEGSQAQVLKAGWDGARLAVWSRPATADAPWTRLWVQTGPLAHQ